MPLYEIEQYELHTSKFRVEAENEADAIAKLLDGEATSVDDSQSFIEVAEDFGLPVDECRDFAKQLVKLGVPVGEHVIPSIRNIEEVA